MSLTVAETDTLGFSELLQWHSLVISYTMLFCCIARTVLIQCWKLIVHVALRSRRFIECQIYSKYIHISRYNILGNVVMAILIGCAGSFFFGTILGATKLQWNGAESSVIICASDTKNLLFKFLTTAWTKSDLKF